MYYIFEAVITCSGCRGQSRTEEARELLSFPSSSLPSPPIPFLSFLSHHFSLPLSSSSLELDLLKYSSPSRVWDRVPAEIEFGGGKIQTENMRWGRSAPRSPLL